MKFFIPAVGTVFELEKPWEFLLYFEERNKTLFQAFGSNVNQLVLKNTDKYGSYGTANICRYFPSVHIYGGGWVEKAAQFSLPPGTVLRVDRVYIRSGQAGEFDSVTLTVKDTTHPFLLYSGKTKSGKKKTSLGRFWVKLCDFNKIDARVLENTARPHIQ